MADLTGQFCDLMGGLAYMHSEYVDNGFYKQMICHGDLKGVGVI